LSPILRDAGLWLFSLFEYTLRLARETDSLSIRKLIHTVGINPTGLDWKRFVVAVGPGGEMIGCGQVKPHGREVLELASIATHPEFRMLGIASAIIKSLVENSARPLYLMCRSPLGPFYEKFGFRVPALKGMPAYFRRISQVAGLIESLGRSGETLLVMKLQ
jgi:N-acetylglutamate synthase-like GNAT family acetyltransferase